MSKYIAPRLHALLAPKVNKALIIRRGPSKVFTTYSWDLETNKIQFGEIYTGHLYFRRSDLSPNGLFFLYFHRDHHDSEDRKTNSGTIISESPSFKAMHFWSKENSWNGGGLFLDHHRVWINETEGKNSLIEQHVQRLNSGGFEFTTKFPFELDFGDEDYGVYVQRLLRDGWKIVPTEHNSNVYLSLSKQLHYDWVLYKNLMIKDDLLELEEGTGVYFETHALAKIDETQHLQFLDWEWADYANSTLYWAESGKLMSAKISIAGLDAQYCIWDFT